MKKAILATSLFLLAGAAPMAQACDSDFCQGRKHGDASWFAPAQPCDTEKIALEAARGVLSAGGPAAAPLTYEVQALSSQPVYAVAFSYSGVQFIYQVAVDSQRCLVKSVELQ